VGPTPGGVQEFHAFEALAIGAGALVTGARAALRLSVSPVGFAVALGPLGPMGAFAVLAGPLLGALIL
jgi:hypothetical protein